MDINSVSSVYINSLTEAKQAKESSESDAFKSMLEQAVASADDEQLKEACSEYEAYFLNKLFDQMRKSIPKSSLMQESQGHDIYEDMLYEEYAKQISTGKGIGIKDMLFKQLKKDH